MYIPNAVIEDVAISTKVVYALVWIPAIFSVYFNLKHAIIPNFDFGFIKAIKPYNCFAVGLAFAELCCLTAWDFLYGVPLVLSTAVFAILCVAMMIAAKKGAEKWTI